VSILEVEELTKIFGGLKAVSGLSFRVEEGTVVGLIGPNGAGKTTTFELISGFQTPTEGYVTFRKERITGLQPNAICLRGLTRTFQIVQAFPKLTVLQNVMIGSFTHHRSMAEARSHAHEVLEGLGMVKRASELALNLTLADLKRLEIAKVLATEPKLILLDEVVAGLTPTEVDEMIQLLRNIQAMGVTLLLVEHVMQAVMSLSDVIIVLDHGEKIFEGTPQAAAEDSRVIEAYLGEDIQFA
jgi:branched-chain amino acid transport system ATP-binding protein